MIDFIPFNKMFFEECESNIHWFGKKGLLRLGNERIVEIEIVTNRVVGEYTGYRIDIINKMTGKITGWYFDFNEYLKERIDDRLDYDGQFKIVEHTCQEVADWYIKRPSDKEVKLMAEEMERFINFYK